MAKNLGMAIMLDYYGPMLTDKQRELLWCYYNEDLSLSEIAANEGITRQAVRDTIKRGEATLTELESKLHIIERMRAVECTLADIRGLAADIRDGAIDSERGADAVCELVDGALG